MRFRRQVRAVLRSAPFRVLVVFFALGCLVFQLFSDMPKQLQGESAFGAEIGPPAHEEVDAARGAAPPQEPAAGGAPPSPSIVDGLHTNFSNGSSTGLVMDWRPAEPDSSAVYLYSAYIDRRKKGQHCVRITAIIKKKTKYVECSYWSVSNQVKTIVGKTKTIRENWNLPYSAAFVLCPIPGFPASDPLARVAVATAKLKSIDYSTSMPVQDLDGRSKIGEMSVCIKPLHYEFNRAVWLVEFVEMYRLLGADRFIFYNHTVGPDVEKVLRQYMKEGTVEVLPWSLPVKTKTDIRTEGIFASLNDCYLRSVGHFPLTAMVDIDEFLLPRKHETLLQLVKEHSNSNAYIFKNVFFYLYWENDTALHDSLSNPIETGANLFGAGSHTPYLLTQTKTRRLSTPHKYSVRSKYIVRPEQVIEVGNHVVWEYVGARSSFSVPEDMGLSHHYRICEFGGFECLKQPNHIDRSAHTFLMPLVRAVASSCKKMFPDQPACPPAPPLGSPW